MAVSKQEILDAIANMTVLDLSELIKEMEEKFGVSAAAAAVAVAAPAAAGAAAVEEQTEFTVMLIAAGEKKVEAIKVVRAATGLGLSFFSNFPVGIIHFRSSRLVIRYTLSLVLLMTTGTTAMRFFL